MYVRRRCIIQSARPERIRTSDPRFRRPMLYPAELWPHVAVDFSALRGEGGIRTLDTVSRIPLSKRCLRPLGHLSELGSDRPGGMQAVLPSHVSIRLSTVGSAEEEGFEPPALSRSGFQDRCLRPLGHSSKEVEATFSASSLHMQAERWARNVDGRPDHYIWTRGCPACPNLV